jgi:hypothetical protein
VRAGEGALMQERKGEGAREGEGGRACGRGCTRKGDGVHKGRQRERQGTRRGKEGVHAGEGARLRERGKEGESEGVQARAWERRGRGCAGAGAGGSEGGRVMVGAVGTELAKSNKRNRGRDSARGRAQEGEARGQVQ